MNEHIHVLPRPPLFSYKIKIMIFLVEVGEFFFILLVYKYLYLNEEYKKKSRKLKKFS